MGQSLTLLHSERPKLHNRVLAVLSAIELKEKNDPAGGQLSEATIYSFNPQSTNQDCSRRHLLIFFRCFTEKIRLNISCESSARQRIHMKHQALFP